MRSLKQNTPVRSPYNFQSLFLKGMALTLVFLLIGGSGISFAAESSLPGDFLYHIKVDINEKVKETSVRTPEKKIAWQEKKVFRRLDEISSLLDQKIVEKNAVKDAKKYLVKSIGELEEASNSLPEKQNGLGLAAINRVNRTAKSHPALTKAKERAGTEEKNEEYTSITEIIENEAIGETENQKDRFIDNILSTVEKSIGNENYEEMNNFTEELSAEIIEEDTEIEENSNNESEDIESILNELEQDLSATSSTSTVTASDKLDLEKMIDEDTEATLKELENELDAIDLSEIE